MSSEQRIPDDLAHRFSEHLGRLAKARRALERPPPATGTSPFAVPQYLALAEETRYGAELYDEATQYVTSELLISSLRESARLGRAQADSYASREFPVIRDASQGII